MPSTEKDPLVGFSYGIDVAGMDKSVAPGDDFFAHANGTWFKTTEIPPDKPAYGAGWAVFDLTTQRTAELIQNAGRTSPPRGSVAQKIADYHASYLDAAGIEARGLKPLQPTLDRIAAISDRKSLARYLGSTLRADVDALNATNFYTDNVLGLWVAQDFDHPGRYAAFLLQGGLDMPDRDYYLDSSDRMKDIRVKFVAHVATLLKAAGVADAGAKAQRIADLERRIAEVHATREESVEVKNAQRWTRAAFDQNVAHLFFHRKMAQGGGREPVAGAEHDHFGACGAKRPGASRRVAIGHDQCPAGKSQHARLLRKAQPSIEDHAQRLVCPQFRFTDVEARIIREHRADARDDCAGHGPQALHVAPRGLPADPARPAFRRRRPAVPADRQLAAHERPALAHAQHEARIERRGVRFQQAVVRANPGLLQQRDLGR